MATDDLLERAQALREFARECVTLRSRLAAIDRRVTLGGLSAAGAPADAARAELDIDEAMAILAEVEAQAWRLEWALGSVAEAYTRVEDLVGDLGRVLLGTLAAFAGRMLPGLLMSHGAGLLGAFGGVLLGSKVAGGDLGDVVHAALGGDGVPKSNEFVREHNEWLNNPLTADIVRGATQMLGTASLGAVLPQGLAVLLGTMGVGTATAAGGVMRAGGTLGMLSETPVRLVESRSVPTDAPAAGYADRFARVPDTDLTDGAQVVIERYETPGEPDRFEVYVAGTVTFSPAPGTEPWDMTSNLSNAAGFDGGSYRATIEAMQAAGITPESPVQFTGYSQGGGTVARLAASGEWNTQGLLTFGGPTGQIPIPGGFPAVIVEHREDIVPALGGDHLETSAVLVEREVFGGREVPDHVAVPAHHAEYYAETAALMDRESDERVQSAIASFDAFALGATGVTSTAYRFERGEEVSVCVPGR